MNTQMLEHFSDAIEKKEKKKKRESAIWDSLIRNWLCAYMRLSVRRNYALCLSYGSACLFNALEERIDNLRTTTT